VAEEEVTQRHDPGPLAVVDVLARGDGVVPREQTQGAVLCTSRVQARRGGIRKHNAATIDLTPAHHHNAGRRQLWW
jgi:hypothetical protein